MWIVFNREDSWECGWQAKNESDAIRQCAKDESLTYYYVRL